MARPTNMPAYRQVIFGSSSYSVSLKYLLKSLKIEPSALASICDRELHPTLFPRPDKYDRLGSFSLDHNSFKHLAKVLGKPIEVWREFPTDADNSYHMFTVTPQGSVTTFS